MADQPAKKQKTDDVDTMGISEMKALIKSAGLSSADCVEKSELLDKEKGNMAVNMAKSDAIIVNATKEWLKGQGIDVELF